MSHARTIGSTLAAACVALLAIGCAARFDPATVRREIVLQRGADPLGLIEVDLGRVTTELIRLAVSSGEEVPAPLQGLRGLQLAVYETPAGEAPALDTRRLSVQGWETALRLHDAERSGMVLVRGGAGTLRDLVIVAAGRRNVVYARLMGTLRPELAGTFGEVLRSEGPDGVRTLLQRFTDSAPPPAASDPGF